VAISWSSFDGKIRVGIDVIFSSNAPVGSTVDVEIRYYIENSSSFNDNQTLTYDKGDGTEVNYNFLNNYGTSQQLIRTVNWNNLPVSYSGGPTYFATAEITGAYDGSNPYKSRGYTLPARQAQVPDAPPTYITGVTNSQAQVYVTAPSNNGSSIDAYQIEIATNSGFTTGYQLANNGNNVFTGLAAATTYYTRARAHNAVGWGPYSTTKTFTTGATVPGAPTGVGNNTVGQTTANVTWTAPASNGGSAITGYQIQKATDSGFTQNVTTVDDPDDVSPYQLTGLNPATLYYARVRAVNGVGAGAWSTATSFTTLTGTPSLVTPSAGEATSRGWAYVIMSATGIQATSTITAEVGKGTAGWTGVAATLTASTNLITRTDAGTHGLVAGDAVFFSAVTAGGVTANAIYYVLASGLTTTAFKVSATPGGTELDITSDGTGTLNKQAGFAYVPMTTATTDLITRADGGAHGLVEGDVIYFSAVSSAPLAINTAYYVIASGLTTTAFKVSTTPGGTAVDITAGGTGTMIRHHTLTLTPGSASANNQYTLQDTAKLLNNGTWHARTRVTTTSISYTTPYSTTNTFTVSHTPSALSVSPATGTTAKWTATTNFTFNFSDPNTIDRMSAYQLVIEDNATAATLYDSGKTALVGTTNSEQFVRSVAISSGDKGKVLRWRVRTWDRNDQVSAYTGYSTLTLVDAPTIAITSPGNASTVNTGTPTFTWTFSAPSGGTQASALIEVRDSSTNTVVWSGSVTGTATSITPAIVILQNGRSYTATLTATDTYGLTSTTSNSFNATYTAPAPVSYSFDGTDADEYGYVDVSWVDATADSLFVSWKVYRKAQSDATDTWVPVFETTDQNVRHYFDYLLLAGETYSYSVTQTAFRSGSVLESPVGYYTDSLSNVVEETRQSTPDITHYWIIDPVTGQNSVRLESVTNDDSTLEFETATYNIIGRGRHRDYGDELGYAGSLTCQVRGTTTTSTFRTKIEELRRAQETYYLRTPFGRLFPVALGDIGWSPIGGTGPYEMGDMTIPYEEVS
jgi:hypothetical protein